MKTTPKKQLLLILRPFSDSEAVEDLLEGIVAERRKNEERVPFETVVQNLKKAGKIS